MNRKELQKELDKFGRYVVQQSRSNLTRGKKNASKELYNSIGFTVETFPNSFSFFFEMEDYGEFQDKGVRGVGGVRRSTSKFKRTNNKGKLWKQKGGNSPFSFKKGDSNKPSVKHFVEWSNRKGLSAFAVREAVYHQGIKPSLFFTKPFEAAFRRLPDELIEAFGLDLDNILTE
jgi:hypothetical protein